MLIKRRIRSKVLDGGGNLKIIAYEDKYRDDLIFMILEAKNALGRVPGLNSDLLDIKKNYMENGDMFWLALDENERVTGSVGYHSIGGTDEVWLHRLFVKYNHKHEGIGTQLLQTAEAYIKQRGKKMIKIHLGTPREQWFESYAFYSKYGYQEYENQYMKKELETKKREGYRL